MNDASKLAADFHNIFFRLPEKIRQLIPKCGFTTNDLPAAVTAVIDPQLITESRVSPPWVRNAAERVFNAFIPTLALNEIFEDSIKVQARILGHLSVIVARYRQGPITSAPIEGQLIPFFLLYAPQMEDRIVAQLRRPPHEVAEFAKEFAYAAERTVDATGFIYGVTDATIIHLLLVIFSEEIERMRSLKELHQALSQFLGSNKAGSLARIRRITRDVGLRFPSGRPSKQK